MSALRRLLGEQLDYTAKVLAAHANPHDAGPGAENAELAAQYTRVVMQVIVSIAVLATGIYLLLHAGSDKQREIGSGLVGIVVGYWLR
jgi:hypothetical protein